MLKDVVSGLDYSLFDEVALVLFTIAFLAILWGTWRLRKESVERFSAIPLSDAIQDPIVPPTGGQTVQKKEKTL